MQNYNEDLRKAAVKYKQRQQDWDTDTKYSCFRNSDLPCRRLPNLPSNLPSSFKNACEPIFALVGTPKSGMLNGGESLGDGWTNRRMDGGGMVLTELVGGETSTNVYNLGTTSFYYYMIQHPQVNQALSGNYNKEVRYFAEFFSKGPGWYVQQFPPITPEDISFPDDVVPRVHMVCNVTASCNTSFANV